MFVCGPLMFAICIYAVLLFLLYVYNHSSSFCRRQYMVRFDLHRESIIGKQADNIQNLIKLELPYLFQDDSNIEPAVQIISRHRFASYRISYHN